MPSLQISPTVAGSGCGSRHAVKPDQLELLYGYRRLVPLYGVDHWLNIERFNVNCSRGSRLSASQQRYIFVQQPFLDPEFRCVRSTDNDVERIHFILTLAGRHETFDRFMQGFEALILTQCGDTVALVVVQFHEVGHTDEVAARIAAAQSRFPDADIRLERLRGKFSRGIGLQRGAELFQQDALLVFIDVDFRISSDAVRRIRMNTVRGRQVYYPIIYSQYNDRWTAAAAAASGIELDASDLFDDNVGYWRHSGFGILAVYNEDFLKVGGFDLDLIGWGLEDVRLFERFIAHNVTVFRAPDVGFVHVFHETVCDSNTVAKQRYEMCLGAKRSSLASAKVLASYVRATPEIYWRNVTYR